MAPAKRGGRGKGKKGGTAAPKQNGNSAGDSDPRPPLEQQQVRAVYDALEAEDYERLRDLAFSRLGFCSSELRRAVWLCLLGVSQDKAKDTSWRRALKPADSNDPDSRTIQVDVQRSVYSWDVHAGMPKTERNKRRIDLSEVMHAILQKHQGQFRYFQGFHDIALVFLEVGTPAQAFHMVERLALFHMTDQLCWQFDTGLVPLLRALFSLLEMVGPACAEALREADCSELHFAIPWVLTWFSHTLPRLHSQVMRLFDCLLASHPAMILYFCVALLLQFEDQILQTERDMPEMVSMLQRLPLDTLDMEDWVNRTRQLALQLPPEKFIARAGQHLQSSGLPPTSPLLHFPHPWMRPGLQVRNGVTPTTVIGKPTPATGAKRRKRKSSQQQQQQQRQEAAQPPPWDPVLKMSPVYDKSLVEKEAADAAYRKAGASAYKPSGRHSAMAILRLFTSKLRPAALLSLLAAAVAAVYTSLRGRGHPR